MRLRNGADGYGAVTKTLHWLTVVAITVQFAVGWTMGADDAALDLEKQRIDRFEDQINEQGEAAEDLFEPEIDRMQDALDAREDNYFTGAFAEPGLSLPEVHVLLGVSIMVLGLLRVLWRMATPLPPWAEYLSTGQRRLGAWLEKTLLTLLFVVPGSGLLLITVGDDWLPLHIAAQLVLLAAIAVHVGLVVKHTIVRRNRHLARML